MKKILFVIESLHLGGAEKSLVTLLNNLDYKKIQVDLIIFKDNGIFRNFIPENINLIVNPSLKLSLKNRILFKILKLLYRSKYHPAQTFWKLIKPTIKNHSLEYDIAIAYNQGFSTYYVENKIKAQKKYAWLNIDYQKAGYNIKFDFPIYKSFDKIITVSKEAKESFENELKFIDKNLNIDIIKDISDEIIIRKQSNEPIELKFKESVINIVTVCRLAKQKGLHLAIESCYKLVKNGYKINWYVVGEGGERNYLESLIKSKNLENHFFLIGAKENPYPYMKSCDIYVQTSLFEGLGLTVIEASILQKPIVCTNFPTSSTIINHNVNGLICEMNSDDISKNIEKLINEKELVTNFIENLKMLKNEDKLKSLEKISKLIEE